MLYSLGQIFAVLFLGTFFSFLFYSPVCNIQAFLEAKIFRFKGQKKAASFFAVLFWYLFLFVFLFLILFLFYWNLYQYFCNVSLEEFAKKGTQLIQNVMNWIPFLDQPEVRERCMDIVFRILEENAQKLVNASMEFLWKLPGIISKLFISVMISIYLLLDRNFYISLYKKWKPRLFSTKQSNMIHVFFREAKEMFFAYWKGQGTDALLMGSILSVGLYLLGVPLGLAIGIFAGIGNLIPYVGPFIAYMFTILFCLLEGKMKTLVLALIFLVVVQFIDGNFINPRLLGKRTKTRPLFVIVSILIGGTLFGIFGMIFAVPVMGTVKSFVKIVVRENEK